jgi:hypothetical protein
MIPINFDFHKIIYNRARVSFIYLYVGQGYQYSFLKKLIGSHNAKSQKFENSRFIFYQFSQTEYYLFIIYLFIFKNILFYFIS